MGPALGLSLHNDINHDGGLALLVLRTLRWFLNFKEGRDRLLTGRGSSIFRMFPDLGWGVGLSLQALRTRRGFSGRPFTAWLLMISGCCCCIPEGPMLPPDALYPSAASRSPPPFPALSPSFS